MGYLLTITSAPHSHRSSTMQLHSLLSGHQSLAFPRISMNSMTWKQPRIHFQVLLIYSFPPSKLPSLLDFLLLFSLHVMALLLQLLHPAGCTHTCWSQRSPIHQEDNLSLLLTVAILSFTPTTSVPLKATSNPLRAPGNSSTQSPSPSLWYNLLLQVIAQKSVTTSYIISILFKFCKGALIKDSSPA